ncbi:MAG: hypothetical protein KY453_10340 [Gemmatimonadetes bacterium]|nr:hypothetical protein [Gemmatimonadota bacterium]
MEDPDHVAALIRHGESLLTRPHGLLVAALRQEQGRLPDEGRNDGVDLRGTALALVVAALPAQAQVDDVQVTETAVDAALNMANILDGVSSGDLVLALDDFVLPPGRAEEVLVRIRIAGALQLVRNAPFEVDVLEAIAFLEEGLAELRLVLEAQERGEELGRLASDAGRWLSGSRASLFSDDPATVYHALAPLADDGSIPHAFRRFAYRQVVLFDVCLASHSDAETRRRHARWREAVEAGLIRRESDRQVLEMMRETVLRVMRRSDVAPALICAPHVVARPDVRMAIMTAPPRRPSSSALADGEE